MYNWHRLRLILSGYNHKLPVLLSKVLAKLAHADLTAERFVVKDIVAREYANGRSSRTST